MAELSEDTWRQLDNIPEEYNGELTEADWKDIAIDEATRRRMRKLRIWQYFKERDERFREWQEGKILDFLKIKAVRDTKDWFEKVMKDKKLRKKLVKLGYRTVELERSDSYCWNVKVIAKKKTGEKVTVMRRLQMNQIKQKDYVKGKHWA